MTPLSRIGASALLIGAAAMVQAQPLPPAPGSAAAEIDRTTGEYFYERYCIECHGRDGRGTIIGFPLVGRPAGVITPEHLLEVLRAPLQVMPKYPKEVINDDVARLIAHYVATLESRASGVPPPPRPDFAANALRPLKPLPAVPAILPADPAAYDMKEYDAACGAGSGLAIAPDGRVWYAGIERNTLAAFNPKTERFQCWTIPTRNARPRGIAVDRDGFVWVTLTGLPDNKVAMFDSKTELFSEFQLPHAPQALTYPNTIVFDADKNPVISLEYGDSVGRFTRRTGRIDIFALPTVRALPIGLAIGKTGHIYAAEFGGNKIAEIDPKTGRVAEYLHPRAAEDPGLRRLVLDARGSIWFTEHEFGSIGLFDPRTRKWKSWRAPALGGTPTGTDAIAIDARGAIWFSHFGGDYIGRFDPAAERFAIYPLPTRDLNCRAIDIAKDGVLWCIGSPAPKLVRLTVKSVR